MDNSFFGIKNKTRKIMCYNYHIKALEIMPDNINNKGDWLYFLAEKQKFIANVVVGLLGNESSDLNRFILVTPKSENDVRLQATLDN